MTKFGLALCGGGARGLAHIGVLAAFDSLGLKPAIISGTSAGAIAAALYAMGIPIKRIIEIANDLNFWKIFHKGWSSSGTMDLVYLEDILRAEIGYRDLSKADPPCLIGLTNLATGKIEYHKSGDTCKLVKGSCAVPPVFAPVTIGGITYVDGGLVENLPAIPIKDTGVYTIGVNVNQAEDQIIPTSVRAIGMRALEILISANSEVALSACDQVINIESVYDIGFLDFKYSKKVIHEGFTTTLKLLQSSPLIDQQNSLSN